MKIQISRDDLLKGIQTVHSVIPLRSTLPILSHILLETQKDSIRLVGTDLELGIACSVPAQIVEEGAITIPAKRFSDLVKELPETHLTITTRKNQQVSIEYARGLFKIMGLPKEEFPRLPNIENNPELMVMDQGVLQAMLGLTAFAVSRDESRYVLTGTLLISKDDEVVLVATDGRRLAMIERRAMSAPKGNRQAIIPFKAVEELHRLLEQNQTVKILMKENQIYFDLGNTQIFSRLIEGKFPNYEQVIPQESPQKLTASREDLLLAARRISLWTTSDSPSIRFDLKQNQLVLSKQTPEIGEAHEELQTQYSGQEFSVGFNPAYLIDVLKALPDSEVALELPGPDRPGVIRTKDHYLYIVLPMQLNP